MSSSEPHSAVPRSDAEPRSDVVPQSSVWAGWDRAKAAAWADALLSYERHRFSTTAQHMLLHALWYDWHDRGTLPELRRWEELARRFEAQGVTADAFERMHRGAGAQPWSPAVDRRQSGTAASNP